MVKEYGEERLPTVVGPLVLSCSAADVGFMRVLCVAVWHCRAEPLGLTCGRGRTQRRLRCWIVTTRRAIRPFRLCCAGLHLWLRLRLTHIHLQHPHITNLILLFDFGYSKCSLGYKIIRNGIDG